jgi:hypothetical protein
MAQADLFGAAAKPRRVVRKAQPKPKGHRKSRDPYENMSDAEAMSELRRINKGGRPRPASRPRRLPLAKRLELLRCVDLGLELDSAAARAGTTAEVVKADVKLLGEVVEAYRKASSRLREKALTLALQQKNGALIEKILDRRDEELTELRKAVPPPPEAAAKRVAVVDGIVEELVRMTERQVRNDPAKHLISLIDAALSSTKLSAEAAEAARALRGVLAEHPPAPYTPEWWERERAAGRNGYAQVAPAALPAPAEPAPSEPEIIPPRPRRMQMLDPERPLPPSRAPATPAQLERWYGANWQDSPWLGR